MRPASSGCLSEQEINLDPGCSVFSSPQEWISFAYLSQGDNLNICPSDTCRLPQAAWLHRNAQCQLPQWPWDGRDHEPNAWSGQWGAIWEHPTRQTGPRADGCSALRPRDGHKHGWHASSGGLRHVSSSGHEQEGRGPLDASRTHKLHTQQVGTCSSGLQRCRRDSDEGCCLVCHYPHDREKWLVLPTCEAVCCDFILM